MRFDNMERFTVIGNIFTRVHLKVLNVVEKTASSIVIFERILNILEFLIIRNQIFKTHIIRI